MLPNLSATAMKAPLAIYVVWHPDFVQGSRYADFLYSSFTRDVAQPLQRGLGIPVFFRSVPESSGLLRPIDFTESDLTLVIPLVDAKMMLASDQWRAYLVDIAQSCEQSDNTRYLVPIALTEGAVNYQPIGSANAIRAEVDESKQVDDQQREQWFVELRRKLLFQLCWFCSTSSDEQATPGIATSHSRLFLSHAKVDGLNPANSVNNYLKNQSILTSFFDVIDIGYGRNFEQALCHHAAHSTALIVFLTDAYASREWCRIEAITAKRYYCPIVVVNAIEKGEKRSFPYLGNVPTIRWIGDNAAEVVELAMTQVLNNLYTKTLLQKQSEFYGGPDRYQLTNSPELFDLIRLRQLMREVDTDSFVVLYPDPPLGTEEIMLLNDSESKALFLTPAHLPILLLKGHD